MTGNGRNYEKGKSDVTVGIRRRERGLGQKNDETTVTNDSSSIVIRPTAAKRCPTEGKPDGSNETRNRRAASGRNQNVLRGTTSRDYCSSTTTYNTQRMGDNTQQTNRRVRWEGSVSRD